LRQEIPSSEEPLGYDGKYPNQIASSAELSIVLAAQRSGSARAASSGPTTLPKRAGCAAQSLVELEQREGAVGGHSTRTFVSIVPLLKKKKKKNLIACRGLGSKEEGSKIRLRNSLD
jgi:hypothetical protein